ncbi:isochorismatase family protein [Rhodobacter capsulatus]|uniref:isochorismatase family protein n=1 Tax=Rhodobacter capsulatus TaxID=1061 RepID=UPI0003D3910A|nr:isochorismatase family protein [Rhodobacter capsulatus]ETD88852.1 isochorismatase [Rhodobacter capsulatus YW2]
MKGTAMGKTALLIIDMQMEMQARLDAGRAAVNREAGAAIAALAAACRAKGVAVVHVRHHDAGPASPLHADAPGAQPMPCDAALPGEAVFVKSTSSAFASTELAAHLRGQGIEKLIITGAVLGFCVTSTVRAAADLGFAVILPRDACLGFDLPGMGLSAEEIARVSFGLLGADFAMLSTTPEVIASL